MCRRRCSIGDSEGAVWSGAAAAEGPEGKRTGEEALDGAARTHTPAPSPTGPWTGWKVLEEASSEPPVRRRTDRRERVRLKTEEKEQKRTVAAHTDTDLQVADFLGASVYWKASLEEEGGCTAGFA